MMRRAAAAAAVAAAAAAAEASAAAIAVCEPPGGCLLSIPKSSASISKKRPRRRKRNSKATSENHPTPAGSIPHIDPSLANYGGEILVLFETPSGFAIFCMKYDLNQPNAMENIWAIFAKDYRAREIVFLKEFRTFKDKSSAINQGTDANKGLADMISRHHRRGQTLAVGKPEYKRFIETSLYVPCLFNETVMEVMWGLKYLMHSLVPQEEVKLTKEDRRLPMCQGIKILLNRYGFDVKPEMVNEKVIVTACFLVDAESIEKTLSASLQWAAGKLKDVSGINPKGWGTMKIVKALKIMFEPILTTEAEMEMFTSEELSTLVRHVDRYEDLIRQDKVLTIHKELVVMRETKKNAVQELATCLIS